MSIHVLLTPKRFTEDNSMDNLNLITQWIMAITKASDA